MSLPEIPPAGYPFGHWKLAVHASLYLKLIQWEVYCVYMVLSSYSLLAWTHSSGLTKLLHKLLWPSQLVSVMGRRPELGSGIRVVAAMLKYRAVEMDGSVQSQ